MFNRFKLSILVKEIENRAWSTKSLSFLLGLIIIFFSVSSLFVNYENIIQQLLVFSVICILLCFFVFGVNIHIEHSTFGLSYYKFYYLKWIPIVYILTILSLVFLMPLWEFFLTHVINIEIEPQDILNELKNLNKPLHLILFIFTSVIVAPLYEELIFRGIIFPKLLENFSFNKSMLISSLIFAVLHLHVPALLPLFILSIVLCYLYVVTGTLWCCISLHALFNAVTVTIYLLIN